MKVVELIEKLRVQDPDAEVLIDDPAGVAGGVAEPVFIVQNDGALMLAPPSMTAIFRELGGDPQEL